MSDEPHRLILHLLTTRCKRWIETATVYAIESDCADVSPLFLLKAWVEPETWKDTFPDGFGDLVASCGGDLVWYRAACDSRIAALPKRTDPQAAILPDADLQRILSEAHATYLRDQALFIDCQDLLAPMRRRGDSVFNQVLKESGVNMENMIQATAASRTGDGSQHPCVLPGGGHKPGMILTGLNKVPLMNKPAESEKRRTGYEAHIGMATRHLLKRQSVVFKGGNGVGKSVCISELVRQVVLGAHPGLETTKFWTLQMLSIGSDPKYKIDRLKVLLEECGMLKDEGVRVVLVFDDIHQLFRCAHPASDGAVIANMLKVAMDEETITILGATTSEQYAEHIVPHQVLDHRLVDIAIDEPSIEQTQKMLSESVCHELDEKRGVKMLDSSLRLSVELASKYMKSSRPFSADWLVEEAYSAAARRARAIEDAKARMRYELEGVRINMRTFESPRNARDPQIETLIRETKAREQQAKAELRRLEHAETQVARDKVERDKLDDQLSKLTQELVRPEIVANLTERQRVISLLADVTGRRNEVNDRLQVYVTEDDVKEGLERITKIRLRAATPEEYQQAAEIGPKLRQVIFGQDKAIDAISKCFLRRLDDPSCQRPIGALLFTGPCGTGKTALGEAVAEHVFGSKRGRLLQISAGSFRGPTARADLLGGQHNRGTLASFVSGAGTGVILVDFVDRGDFHLYELCAEMLQKGSITNEETGVTLNLSKFLFIFTGITGAECIRHRVVFRGYDGHDGPTATDEEKVHVAVRAHFGSNFLKVLDEVVVFEPLVGPAAVSLLEKDVADIKGDYERLKFQLAFTDRAIEWLTVKRQLLDGRVAARALRNGVQSLLLKAYGYSILALRGQSGIVDWSEDGVPGASIEAGEGALVMRDHV